MSGKLPMGIAGNLPRVRYSAAYPTGREHIVFRRKERKGCREVQPRNTLNTRNDCSRVEHVERVEVWIG